MNNKRANHKYAGLVFVDCEAIGLGCPSRGLLTEFGAVHFASEQTFHGMIVSHDMGLAGRWPLPQEAHASAAEREHAVMKRFYEWLKALPVHDKTRLVFISDNPAFDWQWINDSFLRTLGYNPFGHSARRIGDFYAGLKGDFTKASEWKKYRRTKHDHNPVNDALGNAEAFETFAP